MGVPRRGSPISGREGKSGQEVSRVGEDCGVPAPAGEPGAQQTGRG